MIKTSRAKVMLNKNLEKALGLEFELGKIKVDLKAVEDNFASIPYNDIKSQESNMSQQDRFIDARLAGIEAKLDAQVEGIRESVARMQKGFDDAENRFERASTRHDTEIALNRQQAQQEFRDSRRHATVLALSTVLGVAAVIGVAAAFAISWIGEQGSYAKSYGETQVEIQRAADERAEFREAVRTIQATQQSILERLPPPEAE